MTELLVPALPPRTFRTHFRGLVVEALLEAAEAELELHRSAGHRLRARAAARRAERLRQLAEAPPFDRLASRDRFGPEVRRTVTGVWLGTLGLLVADVIIFGIKSWTTSVADLGMVLLTAVWFVVSLDGLARAPEQDEEIVGLDAASELVETAA